jgi:hypothetical protein
MKKYRLLKNKEYIVPAIPPMIVGNSMEEVWYGNIPPAVFSEPEGESEYVAQERSVILELGVFSLGFGWRNINNGRKTPLPKDYEIVCPTLQLAEQPTTGESAEGMVLDDARIWHGDRFPSPTEWQAIKEIIALEAVLQTPSTIGEDSERFVDAPVIQKTRYLKTGSKVRQFSGVNVANEDLPF